MPKSCSRSSVPKTSSLIHDPQPAGPRRRVGRAPAQRSSGAVTSEPMSRTSGPSALGRSCGPYLEQVDAFVFSRAGVRSLLGRRIERTTRRFPRRSTPSPPRTSRSRSETSVWILGYNGPARGRRRGASRAPSRAATDRRDGSTGAWTSCRPVRRLRPTRRSSSRSSRWDRMKDMPGVMEGFAEHVDHSLGAHLLLAGPAVTGVADDPEAAGGARGVH